MPPGAAPPPPAASPMPGPLGQPPAPRPEAHGDPQELPGAARSAATTFGAAAAGLPAPGPCPAFEPPGTPRGRQSCRASSQRGSPKPGAALRGDPKGLEQQGADLAGPPKRSLKGNGLRFGRYPGFSAMLPPEAETWTDQELDVRIRV